MLDRLSGKILHIDFGDCFEVCITKAFLNFTCVLSIYLAFNMNGFTIMNMLSGILFRSVGCDDQREVSRENSISTHKNVD